jgi:hypothetical protein
MPSAAPMICTNPEWSLTSAKQIPPISLCLSTHPHRETFSPTEDMSKLPHKVVLVGQERREETNCLVVLPSVSEEEEEEEEEVTIVLLLFFCCSFRGCVAVVVVVFIVVLLSLAAE